MGTKGTQIVGKHAKQIVDMLNRALADEWLAYYQYWIGAKVVKGPMKDAVITELNQHAMDELRHAGLDADRIIQLGGTPLLKPSDWEKSCNCKYAAPEDPYVMKVLEQNIEGERCAIGVYNNLLKFTRDKDPVTYNMVLQILQDEVMHEEDLQNLSEDLELMVKRGSK
jgi:bacterioferritin